jgi:fatty acid-binding protein DegV
VAKIAGVLGIRIVGKASEEGTLEPVDKCRGENKSLNSIVEHMLHNGLSKGKVRIAHCENEDAARELKNRILAKLGQVDVQIHTCRGLCSYYAEKGGLLVGYEKM